MSVLGANPYVGLRPYEENEGLLFFGRTEQVLELLQRLHQHRFVAVVGGSGSGKSSLLRAGLIPGLKAGYLVADSDKWLIATMKPGRNPRYKLAEALLKGVDPNATHEAATAFAERIEERGVEAVLDLVRPLRAQDRSNFFLLVDQFEELFRFAMGQGGQAGKDESIDFVNIILELSQQQEVPFHVVLTMRSDFIGDCAQFFGLPEALNTSQYLVPRLTRSQLTLAIEAPARLFNIPVNPELTSRLLNDLGKVKDELPLLSHVLMRMWEHEKQADRSGILDLVDYESVGGIQHSLSRHADEALAELSAQERALTRSIFQELTVIDDQGRKIRRPVLHSELMDRTGASEAELQRIIECFNAGGRSFLVLSRTAAGTDQMLDISHESLIRQWVTLGRWVEEEGESAAMYKRLAEARRLHDAGKEDLLSGTSLQNVMEWRVATKPTVAWASRYETGFEKNMAYLEASFAEDRRKKYEAAAEKRGQRKRTITWFVVVSALAVAMLISFLFTLNLSREVGKERKAYCYMSEAGMLVLTDPTQALGFLALGLEMREDSFFMSQAVEIFQTSYFYKTKLKGEGYGSFMQIEVSASGNALAALSEDGFITVMDSAGDHPHRLGPVAGAHTIALSPDGSKILVASQDSVHMMNNRGETLHALSMSIRAMAFHPKGEGSLLVDSVSMGLYDARGAVQHRFGLPKGRVCSVTFSEDGNFLLAGGDDDDAYLWDLRERDQQGRKFRREPRSGDMLTPGRVHSVAFDPDTNYFWTVSHHGQVKRWDLSDQVETKNEIFIGDSLYAISWSPTRDRMLVCDSSSEIQYFWLTDNGFHPQSFMGHSDIAMSAVFTPGMKTAFSASADGTVRSWDIYWDDGMSLNTDSAFKAYLKSDRWDPLPDSVKAVCEEE